MDSDELKMKANKIWESIVTLETDKYDYEQRKLDQDYELKELKERQKLQMRNKAIKKGLDPEAFSGAHPPRIHMFSKYERRTDTRTYGDRKKLYEGGAEIVRAEWLESMWKDKLGEWNKRPKSKLPKWCGVRPGKKEGDPETPEGEEDAGEEDAGESGLARRRETQRHPRARRTLERRPPLRRSTRRRRRITMRRRRRRRSKNIR